MTIWCGFKDDNLLLTLVIQIYFKQIEGFLLPPQYFSIVCKEKYIISLS